MFSYRSFIREDSSPPPPPRGDFSTQLDSLFSVSLALRPSGVQPLHTEMTAYRGRSLHFAKLLFSPHTTTSAGGKRGDRLLLSLQKEGEVDVIQDGRRSHVRPGEFFVLSPARRFQITTGTMCAHSLYIPMDAIRSLMPHIENVTALAVNGATGAGAVIRAALDEVFHLAPTLQEDEADQFAAAMPHLLCAALSSLGRHHEATPARVKQLHRERMRRFVLDNLSDSDLNAAKVADSVGVSERYVYKLFAEEDIALMRWIWAERLDRCRQELARSGRQDSRIGEIAYGWGFNDLAHFSRSFRDRFGCSPREFRKQCCQSTVHSPIPIPVYQLPTAL